MDIGMRKDLPCLRRSRIELPVFQPEMLYPFGKLVGWRIAPVVIGAGRWRMAKNPAALSEFGAPRRRQLDSRDRPQVSGFSNHSHEPRGVISTLALRPCVESRFTLRRIDFTPSSLLCVCVESIKMKTAAMIFVFSFASVLANPALSAASRGDIKPIDLVRLKFEAFNRHDAETIEKIYASGATLNSPDYHNLAGNSQIADTYRRLFEAIPDAKDNLESIENSSSHIYAQFVLTGHLNGAQDKPINVRIISVYAVKDGHIVDDSTYYDRKMP